MLSSYFNITVIAEWVVFILSLLLLRKHTGQWRLFIVWLFLVLCTESLGWYMSYIKKTKSNPLPFNILMIISIPFLAWMLSKAEPLKKVKQIINYVIAGFILLALLNLFFFQGLQVYNSYSETVGNIMLFILCCYFFYCMVQETVDRNFLNYEYFWLATGILLLSLGSVLLYLFLDKLLAYRKQTDINIYGIINYTVNLLLYISLTTAFICRTRTRILT